MLNQQIKQFLIDYSVQNKKENEKSFFKKGKDSYSKEDVFLSSIPVPVQKKIAKENLDIEMPDLEILIKDEYHEVRMTGLFILVFKYEKEKKDKKKFYEFYLKIIDYVNNWDLVDSTAYKIMGDYLLKFNGDLNNKDCEINILEKLSRSQSLWHRRIAVVSTLAFVRKEILDLPYNIVSLLLLDKEDLIAKACGWVLKEAGEVDSKRLEKYIETNYQKLNRTTLRYAIEKFEKDKREKFLKGTF